MMRFALVVLSANGSNALIVLVVEDEFLLRYEAVLRDVGCIVLEARTAAQAEAICRDGGRVDVLLTDINLPDSGSGWDVADTFRAANPGIGVVYVSGNSPDRSRRVRGSLFFDKPYDVADIGKSCREVANASP
jgi:CheY-like chemotaxis protein